MNDDWWIFTFGDGQKHEGRFVKVKGGFLEARSKMIAKYGRNWAFQYSETVWNDIKKDRERGWPMETWLETIE